ncbi:PLAC8-domain-containing protein [Russula ochroleuca]|uniref:PLAC8-domain-containing protein n=1 Tax=Russula ochroleuca TaxID=152965 RepID=A0A9P5JW93_9AGAM|nr:PLAC8-domain-containing protein [Russula ochroleuca]
MADDKRPVNSQPQGTAPMLVGGNRNARNFPIDSDGRRDWSYGLLDCFDRRGLYCWTMGCPCVVYSKNRQRLRSLQNQGRPLVGGGERYDKQCCIYCALSFSGFCWAIKMQSRTRAEVRERYGIREDSNGDYITSWCFAPCALTQERREIELEENSF